jgi:tetratricopeptide (TPR) repeat protein
MKISTCGKWLGLLIIIVVVISLQHIIAQENADSVSWTEDQGKSMKEEFGEITNETFAGIELKVKAVLRKIPLDQIRNITYRDEPPQYMQARELKENGKYLQAIELYNKILSDSRLRTVFKQHILYNIGESYQLAGQLDDASKAYDELLKTYPDSRYFREAYFNKSQCAAKKDYKIALDILDDAKVKAKQKNLEDRFVLEIDFRKAIIMEDNNKFDDAKAIYSRLSQVAQREPSILYRALVGVGRIEIANKNFADAEKAFNEVIEKSDDFLANAGAYNGRADCIIARSSSPDAKTYKNALFDYLHSKVLYPAQPGEPGIEEEKATYYAAYCFEKLAQSLAAEKKKVYINNARALYQELKEKFSRSRFIPEANKRLSELGK